MPSLCSFKKTGNSAGNTLNVKTEIENYYLSQMQWSHSEWGPKPPKFFKM